MIEVETFLTHDTTFSLVCRVKGVAVDLVGTNVTRMVVTAPEFQVDSAVAVTAFDYLTDGADGIVAFDFTDITGLPYGSHLCRLTVYDTLHPNGQPWHDKFELTIHPAQVR